MKTKKPKMFKATKIKLNPIISGTKKKKSDKMKPLLAKPTVKIM